MRFAIGEFAHETSAFCPGLTEVEDFQRRHWTVGLVRQIERARHAATLLQHGASILDAVHEAGYFDRPHLTRSLKRFIG